MTVPAHSFFSAGGKKLPPNHYHWLVCGWNHFSSTLEPSLLFFGDSQYDGLPAIAKSGGQRTWLSFVIYKLVKLPGVKSLIKAWQTANVADPSDQNLSYSPTQDAILSCLTRNSTIFGDIRPPPQRSPPHFSCIAEALPGVPAKNVLLPRCPYSCLVGILGTFFECAFCSCKLFFIFASPLLLQVVLMKSVLLRC